MTACRRTSVLVLFRHHLGLACTPLPRRTSLIALVQLLFDLIAQLRVGILVFRRHFEL